ncbi:MAG: CapA family protein, partial [Cyclobacteriaceae bacterium]
MKRIIPDYRFLFLIIAVLFISTPSTAQTDSLSLDASDTIPQTSEFSLIFTGDVMQHDSQINGAYYKVTDTYEYDSNFYYLKDILSSADYTIANLELTLAGKPYKGYPTFSSPDNLAVSLKNAGIDCLVTANNHSCDRRKKGIVRTIDVLDSLDIPHTGTFKSETARDTLYPMLIEKKGFRIALLNYTYGTNGIPVPSPTVV